MGRNLICGEIMFTVYVVLLHFPIFCCKISFVLIFPFLSQNLFWYDLLAFARRKIEPQIVPVEKKWQIWGMLIIIITCSWELCNHQASLNLSQCGKCFLVLAKHRFVSLNFCICLFHTLVFAACHFKIGKLDWRIVNLACIDDGCIMYRCVRNIARIANAVQCHN